ncbi:hypothetical protein CR513_01289, partial [Mucuna pruriens]
MNRMFLEKFFLTSRTTSIRKEICGIRQHTSETLYDEQLLIQYFYERLMLMDRSMIDVASSGAVMDKTLVAAKNLISNMANNSVRGPATFKVVNEVVAIDNQRLENKITKLTSLVRQLPTLQEIEPNSAEVPTMMDGQQYRQPRDQYSNLRNGSYLMQNVPQRYQQPPPFR